MGESSAAGKSGAAESAAGQSGADRAEDFPHSVRERGRSATVKVTSADGTTSQAAQCPSGTEVTGGGAISDTLSTTVNINSTVPNALAGNESAWRVAMSSSGGLNSDYTVYAVCQAKPAGWSMQGRAEE